MPSIKDTFNQQQYDSYIQNTDYTGALNYLTGLYNKTEDFSEKDAIKPFITNLRQKIHRDESMTRYATSDDQKQKYFFLDAIKNGSSIKGNKYYDEYTRVLGELGNSYDEENPENSRKANQIEFTFNSQDTFRKFLDNMGINEQQMNQMNVLIGSNNSNRTLMVNKSNPFFYDIIRNVYKTQENAISQEPLIVTNSDNIFFPMAQVDRRLASSGIYYKAYDKKGNAIGKTSTLYDGKFNNAMTTIDTMIHDAESNYENLNKLANQDLIVSSFSLPWKTAAHARAEELLNSTGDTEEYNRTVERLDGQLETALYSLILSQQNVYSTLGEDDPNYHKLSLEDAHKYQQILRDALREKRYNVQMAMFGDKFGYQIDITPKADSKGGFFSGEDNSKIHRTMFIENPWPDEDMTRAFEQRTEFRAIKEMILMDMYKYPYDFDDGSSLTMTNANAGIYRHSDGYEEQVSKDKALSILNESFIKEDGIRSFQRKYFDSQNRPKFTIGKFEDEVDKNAWLFAQRGAKELVPDTESNEYIAKAYDIYQSILNGINYKNKPAIQQVK